MTDRLARTLAAFALAVVLATTPAVADAKPKTQRARIHSLEYQVRELRAELREMRVEQAETKDTADTALSAVQCTYELPFLWQPATETFHPLGIDEVTADSMWIVFGATGADCEGTVVSPPSFGRRLR